MAFDDLFGLTPLGGGDNDPRQVVDQLTTRALQPLPPRQRPAPFVRSGSSVTRTPASATPTGGLSNDPGDWITPAEPAAKTTEPEDPGDWITPADDVPIPKARPDVGPNPVTGGDMVDQSIDFETFDTGKTHADGTPIKDTRPFRSGGRILDTNEGKQWGMLTGNEAYEQQQARITQAEKALEAARAEVPAAKKRLDDLVTSTGGAAGHNYRREQRRVAGINQAEAGVKAAEAELNEARRAGLPTQTGFRDKEERVIKSVGGAVRSSLDTVRGLAELAIPNPNPIVSVLAPDVAKKQTDQANAAKKWMKDSVDEFGNAVSRSAAPDPTKDEDFGSKVTEGAASMAVFMAGGAATRLLGLPGWLGTGGLGALQSGGGGLKDVEDKISTVEGTIAEMKAQGFDASKEEKQLQFLRQAKYVSLFANMGLGATEALPIERFLHRLNEVAGGNRVAQILATTASQTIEEVMQEVGQTIGENVVAKLIHDEGREIFKGVQDAASVSAVLGGGMGFGAGLISSGRSGAHGLPPIGAPAPIPPQLNPTPGPAAPPAPGAAAPAQVSTGPAPVTSAPAEVSTAPAEVTTDPLEVTTTPPATADEEALPPISQIPEAPMLRAYGYTDEMIQQMSPDERAIEAQAAIEAGMEPEEIDGADEQPAAATALSEKALADDPGDWITPDEPSGEAPVPANLSSAASNASSDEVYQRAVDLVRKDGKPSTSYIQRKLGLGYNQAADLVARMEKEGIVSPASASGKRTIISAPSTGAAKNVDPGDWVTPPDDLGPLPKPKVRRVPKATRPLSAMEFLAMRGGLKQDGDLKSMGLDSRTKVNIPGIGFRNVMSSKGVALDHAHELLVEAGYLPSTPDYMPGDSGHTELVRQILDKELRGIRSFAAGDETTDIDARAKREVDEANERLDSYKAEVTSALAEYEITDARPEDIARAAALVLDQGLDPVEAYEHVIALAIAQGDSLTDDQVDALELRNTFDDLEAQEEARDRESVEDQRVEDRGWPEALPDDPVGDAPDEAGERAEEQADPGREDVAKPAEGDSRPLTEKTDAGEQHVLPGAEKDSDADQAQRKADQALKPKVSQKPADDGLFGDGHKQTDLMDMVAKPAPAVDKEVNKRPKLDLPEGFKVTKRVRNLKGGGTAERFALYKDGAEVGVFDTREQAQAAAKPAEKTKFGFDELKALYDQLKGEIGFSAVSIHELIKRSGQPKEGIHRIIMDGVKAGRMMPHHTTRDVASYPVEQRANWLRLPEFEEPFVNVVLKSEPEKKVEQPKQPGIDDDVADAVAKALAAIEETPAKPQSTKRTAPRTKREIAKSAASNTGNAMVEIARGLDALFITDRKNKLSEGGLDFDAETYEKAKPFFRNATKHLAGAYKDIREFATLFIQELLKVGFDKAKLAKLTPYIMQFVQDVKSGKEKLTASLADRFSEHFGKGEGFPTILAARKMAKDNGFDEDHKGVEEAIELALVKTARDLATKPDAYKQLVDLYGRQPRLGTRTSTQMRDQAFSTPVPLAYLASRLAGITESTTVLEPTAGNGALVMQASPAKTTINEINDVRAANLKEQGFAPTSIDATKLGGFKPDSVDVVIANPPFGAVIEENSSKVYDLGEIQPGYRTTQIDHVIALRSLAAMKDGGRAVLIIGGPAKTATSDEARSNAYNVKSKREFFKALYDRYNVTDHFTVAGELYERQGAGWPVDVIVIDGRGKSARSLPAVAIPPIFKSWDALGGILNERRSNSGPAQRAAVGDASEPAQKRDGGVREDAQRPPEQSAKPIEPAGLGGRPDERQRDQAPGPQQPGQRDEPAVGRDTAGRGAAPAAERSPPRVEQETATQVVYAPKSAGGNSLGTLVPVNMRASIAGALDALAEKRGDIDAFVADALGYPLEQLSKYFAQEQVDALALTIDNLERGSGFIIGDQTGIGKGRVNAGVIRWAIKNGRMPIFVTEKPNLYSDMYRDMSDIDVQSFLGHEPRILVTNSSLKLPLDEDGKQSIGTRDSAKHNAMLNELTDENIRDRFDMVFTNYSQMQTVKNEDTARRRLLSEIAPNSVVIFDESHNAGGQGDVPTSGDKKTNRAGFARQLVARANGVFYSSATYAKRPDVMDLYAATDMTMAVANPAELGEAIARGGVPMQQVVASMLAKAGQYIRRERSFAGVVYDTPVVDVDNAQYDGISRSLAGIQTFSRVREYAVKNLDARLKADAASISADGSTGGAGASSINFTSVMHNLINQMLLALKVEPAATMAIEAIKRGEKPVLTLANTMESFLNDLADELDIRVGQQIDGDFSKVLKKYLERTRTVTIKQPFSKEKGVKHYLTDADLGPMGVQQYNQALAQIESLDLSNLSLSPIDRLKSRIEAAGYKVGEITGRTSTIDYSGRQPVLSARKDSERSIKGRRATISKFNSGELDVVILNQAGSTGISLHASEKFKDQRQRHMILVQPEANIDTHMQMLGRVHRTGQVVLPRYSQMIANIPAEKRPAAVLAKKMASLNASTTASRGGALTSESVVDFMNIYGDMVAAAMIGEDPGLNSALGSPVKVKDSGGVDPEDAMRKVTGRIPLLSLAEQTALYEQLEAEYDALLKQMNAAGQNALEAQTLDLKAETKARSEVVAPKGDGKSPFAAPVTIEQVSVRRLGKPFSSIEVVSKLAGDKYGTITAENAAEKLAQIERSSIVSTAALQEFEHYKRGLLDDIEEGPRNDTERARLDEIKDRWLAILSTLKPGARVTLRTASGNLTAIALDVVRKGKAKNPLALSTWKAALAIADASRQITVPFSRLFEKDKSNSEDTFAIEVVPIEDWIEKPRQTLERFDSMQGDAREERYIATGNLLAAYDWLNTRGRIINYTDANGTIQQGILTPSDFKFAEHAAAKGRALDAREAEQWLRANPGQFLESIDKIVRIRVVANQRPTQIAVQVERSKRMGGKYFLDRELGTLIGDMSLQAGWMSAFPYDTQLNRLSKIVNRLQQLGAKFVEKTTKARMVPTGTPMMQALSAPTTMKAWELSVIATDEKIAEMPKATVENLYGQVTGTFRKFGNKADAVAALKELRDEAAPVAAATDEEFDDEQTEYEDNGDTAEWVDNLPDEAHEFLDDEYHTSYLDDVPWPVKYDVAYDDDAGKALIANVRIEYERGHLTDEAGETIYDDEGDPIQDPDDLDDGDYPAEDILDEGTLSDLVDEILEIERDRVEERQAAIEYENLPPEERQAIEAREAAERQAADQQTTREINDAIDQALADGWQPRRDETGIILLGDAVIPESLRRFASPASAAKIRARIDRGMARRDMRPSQSPATTQRMDDILSMMKDLARRVAGRDVDIQLFEGSHLPYDPTTMDDTGYGDMAVEAPRAMYWPAQRLVQLAMAYSSGDLVGSLMHELWHDLEVHLLTADELSILKRETPRLRTLVQAYLGAQVDAKQLADFEVRAFAFQAWNEAQQKGSRVRIHFGVDRLFHKLAEFLRRISNFIRGQGYESAEDLFGNAVSGQYANRFSRGARSLASLNGPPMFSLLGKDGEEQEAELSLPFEAEWGNPRYNGDDRKRALDRLSQIHQLNAKAPFKEFVQARDDINQIVAQMFYYRPGIDREKLREYSTDVQSYVGKKLSHRVGGEDPLLHPRNAYHEELEPIIAAARSAVDHLLSLRRAGLRAVLRDGENTDPNGDRVPVDVAATMRSGFYFQAGRKLAAVPDALFNQGGWAVINHLRQAGVKQAEIHHFQLDTKLGNKKRVTREEFETAIRDRSFDFRRKTSWLNPEVSQKNYKLGGTRAFRGPRIPGRGVYFEGLMAWPKKLPNKEEFLPGEFESPHWEEQLKGTWASWRGSVREVPGWGKMLIGEEGQSDFIQGGLGNGDDWTGRRPRVSTDEYLKFKGEKDAYAKTMAQARSLAFDAFRLHGVLDHTYAMGLMRDLVPSEAKVELAPQEWRDMLYQARVGTTAQLLIEPSLRWRIDQAVKAMDKLADLHTANEKFFAPGARASYLKRELTPESPLDESYVRTMVRDLLMRAARAKADSVAISTSDTTQRIQTNTLTTAAHFYDQQLKPALEAELRRLTGDGSVKLEKVALEKPLGAKKDRPYTVWAAKLPAEVRAKVAAGQPMFRLSEAPQLTTDQVTPAAAEKIDAIQELLTTAIRRMTGDRTTVKFVNDRTLTYAGKKEGWGSVGEQSNMVADGAYNVPGRIIQLALRGQTLVSTAFHEAFHDIEAHLFTPRELKLMQRETATRLRKIVADHFGYTADQVAEMAGYEIRAMAFEIYVASREAAGKGGANLQFHAGIRLLFDKLLKLLRSVANGLRGLGFHTAEDIFGQAFEGKFGERDRARAAAEQASTTESGMPETALALGSRRRAVRPQSGVLPVPQLAMPPSTVAAAMNNPTATTRERLSAAFDAVMRTPSRAVWDRLIDLARLQRSAQLMSGPLSESLDTHLAAQLYYGKVGERMKDVVHDLIDPMKEEMAKRNVDREDLHTYLYARHAIERNAQIAAIRPGVHDGSGMTDQQATQLLNDINNSGRMADYQAVAAFVDRLIAHNRNLMETSGLESRATLLRWQQAYQHYVPLQGFELPGPDEDGVTPSKGKGFDVRYSETKRAFGRSSRAADILTNLIDQTARTVIRAEKNRVARTFLRFAQRFPSPLYKFGLAQQKWDIDHSTGLAIRVWVNGNPEAKDVFAAKVGGQTYFIAIAHGGLLEALKSVGADAMNPFMRMIAAYTRQYSAFQTARNPEFVLTNLIRDLGDASINLTAEQRAGYLKAFTKYMLSGRAFLAAAAGELDLKNNRHGQLYDEWRQAGGKISVYAFKTLETLRKDIDNDLARANESTLKTVVSTPWRTVNPFSGHMVRALESMSEVTESTTRLAIYAAGREIGLTKAQAARAARTMTIDFNAKGKYGPYIQALYAFSNPAIQGTVGMLRRMKSKHFRRALAGVTGMGAMMTLYNLWAAPADDDDKKKSLYQKHKYWEREQNFIIYIPGQKTAIKLPMPFVFRPFFMAGENAVMAAMGKTPVTEALSNWLGTSAKAFNPLGGEGSIFSASNITSAILPTFADPIAELAYNRNWLNRSIHPDERPWNKAIPHSEQSKITTSPIAATVAEWMNRATGGNAFSKGKVDLYPDDLEYVWNYALGGFGKTMTNVIGMATDAALGVDTPTEKIPFLRRFVTSVAGGQGARDDYYENHFLASEEADRYRNAKRAEKAGTDLVDARKTIDELGPKVGAYAGPRGGIRTQVDDLYRGGDKRLKALREEERTLRRDPEISRGDRATKLRENRSLQESEMRDTTRTLRELGLIK